jgi:hypothetical protein
MISVNFFDLTQGGQGSLPFLTAIPVEITPLTFPVWRNKVMSYSELLKQPKTYTIEGFTNIMSESLYWDTNPDDFNSSLFSAISENLVVDWYDQNENYIAKAKVVMTDSNNTFKLNERVCILKENLVNNYKWTKFDELEKGKRLSRSYYIVNPSDCYRKYYECDEISRKNRGLGNSKVSEILATTTIETMEVELISAAEIKTSSYDYIDPPHYSDDSGDSLLEDNITVSEPEYWTDDDYEVLPQDKSKPKTVAAPKKEKQKRARLPLDEFKKRMDAVREKERQTGVSEWQIRAVDYFATLTSRSGRFRFSHANALIEVLKKYPQLQTTEKLSNLIQARRARMKAI